MSGEGSMAKKPLSPIIDRYRAMLKEREAELRVSLGIENVPPPSREEILRLFELLLSDLTLNSKPIITDLTIISGELKEHGEGITDTICARIFEVPVEQKLPSLYLVDSIVKNIGKEYIRHFSSHLPQVFWEAYRQVHPDLHPSMIHLFKTWSTVFPPTVLRKIEAQLEVPPPENVPPSGLATLRAPESPQPSHGIHVNPRYLEERRQLVHSTLDNNKQHNSKISGQKPSSAHDGYAADNADFLSSRVSLSDHKLSISSATRVANSAEFITGLGRSPPQGDDVFMNGSPRRVVDKASHSDIQFGYGLGIIGVGEHPIDVAHRRRHETPAMFSNGIELQGPRALVNAYGNDQWSTQPNSTHLRPGTRNWQNTEEEEYHWEAMSPTSLDHSRTNDLQSLPVLDLESIRERPANDSSATFGVGFPTLNAGHGSSNKDASPDLWKSEAPAAAIPSSSTGVWPPVNVQKHNLLPPLPPPPPQRPMMRPYETINPSNVFLNNSMNRPFSPQYQFDGIKSNGPNSMKLPSFLNQQVGYATSNPQNQPQLPPSSVVSMPWLPPPPPPPPHGAPSLVSMTLLPRPLSHGYPLRMQNNVFNSFTPNLVPGPRPFMPILNSPNNSLPWQGGGYPPLPPGPRHTPSQMMPPIPQNSAPPPSQQPGGALSGLIGSLMAQGLLKPTPAQENVGVEFNPDILKVRHESAITALYADLPRQCTTCGLRFKSQEDHRSHMDWHVTRNRESKNQKQKPSRKWFVSVDMWLTGVEALGSDAVPGFLQTQSVVEKKDDEELAVPADEDQTACALCGESFDDFYSDETEEWMYKGAVYLNVSNGSTSGLNRSQLGPIVHAKCMSDTSVVPAGDSGKHERGFMEEGIERKRLRIC